MVHSALHPTVRAWFEESFAGATPAQEAGWPRIRGGENVLIAAPTGSGKTLAAFLQAIDALALQPELEPGVQVVYVSPLKALGNDIQKNLRGPLDALRERDPSFPHIDVAVRSGDTTSSERTRMLRKPPHILVTTPESLYILLTSAGGRSMLSTAKTLIVDEIHAVLGDKRGAHLALSIERLEALAGPLQRIGLSATQKPLDRVGRFLVGPERECSLVDVGHLRTLDLDIVLPESPLSVVCSNETWEEIYRHMAGLIEEHHTTLIFANTRKMAEKTAARLTELLGEEVVTSHHGSLAKELRLDAETRLKEGKLKALIATASLEMGIDVGKVDLVIQIGVPSSIATFLQRIGRAGHGVGRIPKGRIFPLTRDELVGAAACLQAVRCGELDRNQEPRGCLDVLSQQIVAACVNEDWQEDELFALFRRAWPYRELEREDFDKALEIHTTSGRASLLHRDQVNGRVRATRSARLTALTSGGTIPDKGEYRVIQQPEEVFIGTVEEDFIFESDAGQIFQLGNTSWQILKVETGVVRVADASGQPPTLPFWFGEAPSRTPELCHAVAEVREAGGDQEVLQEKSGIDDASAVQICEYVREGIKVLGAVPTPKRVILERFFDDSGGMQLVLHAPLGGRINRSWGLALRKRFCRGFGFELQAAATEDAILISLGPHHSFPLEDVFNFLHPNSARKVLTQAMLDSPFFATRFRWNATRMLLLPRMRSGKPMPIHLARMKADDLMVKHFPDVMACGENLPGGDLDIPMDDLLVAQTVDDCLHEVLDVDGFLQVLRDLKDGTIETRCVDTPVPSVFSHAILNANPYAFLDDAPLEERRTLAVSTARRGLDRETVSALGDLDPNAVARVREEVWPDPDSADEVHELLQWAGWLEDHEVEAWRAWLEELRLSGRVVCEDGRWMATESTRDPLEMLSGRLEILGPVTFEDPNLRQLEVRGEVLRTKLDGEDAWCNRRLLARIHRYTLETLRERIKPVSAATYLAFLGDWQGALEESRREGPAGLMEVIRQLAGFAAPAAAWEKEILPARMKEYRRDWLDQLTLGGEVAWGRLYGSAKSALKTTPICLVPREDLETWLDLTRPEDQEEDGALSGNAQDVLEVMRERGAVFPAELNKRCRLLPSHLEDALSELIAAGRLTADSFLALRRLLAPPSRRSLNARLVGRWAMLRDEGAREEGESESPLSFLIDRLLQRYGVLFRRVLERERMGIPWRRMVRELRLRELRGEVHGGRFVAGFSGEQFALPSAVKRLRKLRDQELPDLSISAADPLNLRGILTPDARVSSGTKQRVQLI